MMPDQPSDPRLGATIAGYKIERRIGRGGMGVVYLAEHLTLKRRAAFKLIAPELGESEGFRERFLREARIAAGLNHPNIVTVYDAGEAEGGVLYLAMQYIPGSDLSQILHRERRLGPYRVLDFARQIASALDTAHASGLIHRDVKPANVLIDGRHAYLTDFGLTKMRGASDATQLTRSGEVVGTTHYLAPEQVEGKDLDGRADVYALACLIFHCLTGRVVFPRDSDMAVMYAHVHDDPPSLSEERPGLPEELDAVMEKGLDKSPERRFGTCEEMIVAARAVVDSVGPLSESSATKKPSSSANRVPPSGDPSSMTTDTGRDVPSTGDPSSMHTLTGVVGPGGRQAIILLAGVDSNARAIARVALGHRCEIIEAETAEAAVVMARERRPDVVLVDSASSDAVAVCAGIRSDPVTRDAKIVLLAGGREGGKRAVANLGADDLIATPFSPLQLQVKLRRLLGGRAVGA
jgi:serine/threonine-protein kinase